MKKYIFLAFALFGMLSIGSCNDDEPIVPPSPGEEIEIPEPVTPVLVQTLYFDFGSNGYRSHTNCCNWRPQRVPDSYKNRRIKPIKKQYLPARRYCFFLLTPFATPAHLCRQKRRPVGEWKLLERAILQETESFRSLAARQSHHCPYVDRKRRQGV